MATLSMDRVFVPELKSFDAESSCRTVGLYEGVVWHQVDTSLLPPLSGGYFPVCMDLELYSAICEMAASAAAPNRFCRDKLHDWLQMQYQCRSDLNDVYLTVAIREVMAMKLMRMYVADAPEGYLAVYRGSGRYVDHAIRTGSDYIAESDSLPGYYQKHQTMLGTPAACLEQLLNDTSGFVRIFVANKVLRNDDKNPDNILLTSTKGRLQCYPIDMEEALVDAGISDLRKADALMRELQTRVSAGLFDFFKGYEHGLDIRSAVEKSLTPERVLKILEGASYRRYFDVVTFAENACETWGVGKRGQSYLNQRLRILAYRQQRMSALLSAMVAPSLPKRHVSEEQKYFLQELMLYEKSVKKYGDFCDKHKKRLGNMWSCCFEDRFAEESTLAHVQSALGDKRFKVWAALRYEVDVTFSLGGDVRASNDVVKRCLLWEAPKSTSEERAPTSIAKVSP